MPDFIAYLVNELFNLFHWPDGFCGHPIQMVVQLMPCLPARWPYGRRVGARCPDADLFIIRKMAT
jgi:hypothetical protein